MTAVDVDIYFQFQFVFYFSHEGIRKLGIDMCYWIILLQIGFLSRE